MKNNLRWWFWTCLTLLTIAISAYFGFFSVLYASDVTFIGFSIILVYVICTGYISASLYRRVAINFDNLEYIADSMEKMGMIGTVVGLILSFSTFFSHLDLSSVETVKEIIGTVAVGISTALYTTLIGMVSSFFLKTQLTLLGHGNEQET